MRSIILLLFFIPFLSIAQKKQITLEDIFKKGTFRGEFVPGFITKTDDSLFDPNDIVDENGKKIETRDYEISADKKKGDIFQWTRTHLPPLFQVKCVRV